MESKRALHEGAFLLTKLVTKSAQNPGVPGESPVVAIVEGPGLQSAARVHG